MVNTRKTKSQSLPATNTMTQIEDKRLWLMINETRQTPLCVCVCVSVREIAHKHTSHVKLQKKFRYFLLKSKTKNSQFTDTVRQIALLCAYK